MNITLPDILTHKKAEVAKMDYCPFPRKRPLHEPLFPLQERPFIAEIKRASPSEGMIAADVDVVQQACAYQEHGAGAISVLTDERYFGGSFQLMRKVSKAVNIPVLCKDFIISKRQIDWAYGAGADIVLLMASVLSPRRLKVLHEYAREIGLQVLMEVHTAAELRVTEPLHPDILGVNSRNLRQMKIDKQAAADLLASLPTGPTVELGFDDEGRLYPIAELKGPIKMTGEPRLIRHVGPCLRVAESGISGAEDVTMLAKAGANVFLVGTYLMRSSDLSESFAELYRGLELARQ